MHVNAAIAFPGDGAADAVANAERPMPLPFAFAQRRQGIDCLPALADRKHERVFVHRHVAIAKFAGELDLGRNMGETFDQTFADSAGMESRSASGQNDPVDIPQFPRRHVESTELGGALFDGETAAHRIPDGVRLLKDLLEHEMG